MHNLWTCYIFMVALDKYNIQLAYKVRNYLLYNLFQILLIELMSSCACFMSIQICDFKYTFDIRNIL